MINLFFNILKCDIIVAQVDKAIIDQNIAAVKVDLFNTETMVPFLNRSTYVLFASRLLAHQMSHPKDKRTNELSQ